MGFSTLVHFTTTLNMCVGVCLISHLLIVLQPQAKYMHSQQQHHFWS